MTDVRTAELPDVPLLAAVLADAFTDDPLFAWAFPDVAARPRLLAGLFGFLAEHVYVPLGASVVAGDAAALWRPPGASGGSEEFWAANGAAFVTAIEGVVKRIGAVSAAMDAAHPVEPHWYLLSLGVRPGAQGRGIGGALLAHTLRTADEQRAPAYLEATSPRSRVLYERYGFDVVAELTADGSPPMWAMWREPR